MQAVDLFEPEKVQVFDVKTGERVSPETLKQIQIKQKTNQIKQNQLKLL